MAFFALKPLVSSRARAYIYLVVVAARATNAFMRDSTMIEICYSLCRQYRVVFIPHQSRYEVQMWHGMGFKTFVRTVNEAVAFAYI